MIVGVGLRLGGSEAEPRLSMPPPVPSSSNARGRGGGWMRRGGVVWGCCCCWRVLMAAGEREAMPVFWVVWEGGEGWW